MGKRGWHQDRGAGWTEGPCWYSGEPVNMCVSVNLESAACVPALVTFGLCQLKRRRTLVCARVLREPCAWVRQSL